MLSTKQLVEMLQMQASMNAAVNPSWLTADYDFLRAAMVEGALALEHFGWKWWKAQRSDLAQFEMELVDIWHFALSHYLVQAKGNLAEAAGLITSGSFSQDQIHFDLNSFSLVELDTREKLDLMIGLAASKRFSVPLFGALLSDCGLSWRNLHLQYIAKNVLNRFRQDHGYKQGMYVKIWNGQEDNEVLTDIIKGLPDQEDLLARLYDELKQRYPGIKQAS